jgi:hypothetical protein
MESHLDGWEFAVEAWIHDGKIAVSQHLRVRDPGLLRVRARQPGTGDSTARTSRGRSNELIKTFDIQFGFVHPEYFVTSDGEMYFGEVAYRPPGFKVFELLERAYGFNAYQGMILSFDPKATKEEIQSFFPKEVVESATGFAGCFRRLSRVVASSASLEIPEETAGAPVLRIPRADAADGGDGRPNGPPSGRTGDWCTSRATIPMSSATCCAPRRTWTSTSEQFGPWRTTRLTAEAPPAEEGTCTPTTLPWAICIG